MSEELLNRAYRVNYWQLNEFYMIAVDFPNQWVQEEIDKRERLQSRIVESLGYMPVA